MMNEDPMAKIMVSALFILVIAFGLSACGSAQSAEPAIDPNQLYTMAAQTVVAQLTESALKNPPTNTPVPPTPEPTSTPLPPPTVEVQPTIPPIEGPTEAAAPNATRPKAFSGEHASYGYQHPADGSTLSPGQKFMLVFGAVNDGTSTWGTNYRWVFLGGTQLSGIDTVANKKPVPPGQKAEMDLAATAPSDKGKYISRWKFINPNGVLLLEVYFQFKVE
jgi:hypothetical protein